MFVCLSLNFFECFVKMDEDQWMYDNIMSEEVNTNEENGDEPGVFQNIDCFDIFNTSQVLIWFCFLLLLK